MIDIEDRTELVNPIDTTDAPNSEKNNATAGGIRWTTRPPCDWKMQ